MTENLSNFTDVLAENEVIGDSQQSQPLSLPSSTDARIQIRNNFESNGRIRPAKGTGQYNEFRSIEEIDSKYRDVFVYPFFNLVQSRVIEDALYSDKSLVVCAPTGSGKTVVFEMAIVQLLMEIEEKGSTEDFKIIYIAPVKALCTERLTEWYAKFTKLGLMCIEVTGDTDVDFSQLQAFKIIITTPEKWDMLTRRWKDHRGLVEMIKLFLIDEVHILNDESRGPVLEAVVSRMKTIQSAAQHAHRIERLQKQYQSTSTQEDRVVPRQDSAPTIRFVAVSATVSNPEDVADWLKTDDKPAVYYKFGDECRPVKLRRVVEGYPCPDGTSIFKFDIVLNYKLWPIIQKYHDGKPTLIFCNTRKSVLLTAETLSREITITFSPEQKAKLTALASTIKNKKLQALVLAGVGCHHAGLLYEERTYIEYAFRNGDLPILITTTTLAMGVNLPAHLVIIKNTQRYVNGAYQEYSISTVLQMVGRAGRPQFDTDATAVIMTRQRDKARYQALAGGSEPLQSYLHKRLAENLNSETALGTVCDVAQCVQWLRSTFLYVRAARDPKRYLGLTATAPDHLILKKIEELCVRAMNGLASAGLISMDEASCIETTEAGRLMSVFYLDLETMKLIMKVQGNESLERLLWIICECHELADMHLRTDERRTLNTLNRNNAAATIRFPMKGKISSRQMKLNCMIQAVLGCLPIPDPSLNQEALKIMRIADRVCKCLVAYVTRQEPVAIQLQYYSAVFNTIILAKCIAAHLWENSPYVSKQLKGIGPTFSTLLATAGKINFMLLEESHPRDLERIMNKSAPAGNVLRKQISLLPKYQLEATPINERTVSVKLLLLNQTHLSENMDNLTAGQTHKCYVIAGDSENYLLLLTSFIDKDLIRVYDGTITYEIKRKHSFEHKITVHCVSSSFVGIDAQCEYTFKDLMPTGQNHAGIDISSRFFDGTTKNTMNKQTVSVETTKERKRKNNSDEISQSKEKKKRDNALAQTFRLLKESFGRTSTVLKKDLEKTEEMTRNVLNDLGYPDLPANEPLSKANNDINTVIIDEPFGLPNTDNFPDDDDDIMDDEKINSILSEIETEITKVNIEPGRQVIDLTQKNDSGNNYKLFDKTNSTIKNNQTARKRFSKPRNTKSNFEFLDNLEKNTDCDLQEMPVRETGFSEAIKIQIDNFMQNSYKAPPFALDLTLSTEIPEFSESTNCMSNEVNHIISAYSEINFQGNDLPKNTTTVNDNDQKELDKCTSVQVENFDEELPEINITGPINDEVPTCNSEMKNNNDGHENNQTNDFITCDSMRQSSLRETYSDGHNRNKSHVKLETDGITNNNISDNPKPKGLGDIDDDPVSSNDELKNKSVTICSNPQNNLQHCLVPICNTTAFVSIPNQIATDSTVNDVIAWSQRQNQIALQPNNNYVAKNYPSISQNETLGGSQSHSQSMKNINTYWNQNLNNTSTEHRSYSEITKNNTEYENKYSFTAEKVDVHTKYTNDHKIRIIRRLKVDLDVREIFSKSMNKSDSNFDTHKQNISSYLQSKNENFETRNVLAIDQNNVTLKESPKTFPIAQTNQIRRKTHMIQNKQTQQDSKPKRPNKVCNNPEEMQHYVFHNEHLSNDNMAQEVTNKAPDVDKQDKSINATDVIQQNNEKLQCFTTTVDPETKDVKQSDKITAEKGTTDVDVPRKENKIENILQKYAEMIRKSKTTDVKSTPNILTSDKKYTNPAPFKANRPFKITEIQNLNVPLLSFSEKVIPPPGNVSQSGNVQSLIANRTFTPLSTLPVVENLPEKPQAHIQAHIQTIDLTPCQSPVKFLEQSLEISEEEDLTLDQSMFDPKTLLQNIGRDDMNLEIIPPPPEFCNLENDINYSPEMDENFASPSYSEINQTFEESLSTSVLEDVFPHTSNLTPSKEIETWTLDQDNELDNSFNHTTPTQSYTVMRRKMFQNYNQLHDSQEGIRRQGRLSKFKFNGKNKLKM